MSNERPVVVLRSGDGRHNNANVADPLRCVHPAGRAEHHTTRSAFCAMILNLLSNRRRNTKDDNSIMRKKHHKNDIKPIARSDAPLPARLNDEAITLSVLFHIRSD